MPAFNITVGSRTLRLGLVVASGLTLLASLLLVLDAAQPVFSSTKTPAADARDLPPGPEQPGQPAHTPLRASVTGTSQEKALAWLDAQTESFVDVHDIPGYKIVGTTPVVERYKSFPQDGTITVRKAWYSPTLGAYLVSYDFASYGTPGQKSSLGRFGRGFTYDQGLALIARCLASQPAQAQAIAGYVGSFQNSGQLATTAPGSIGFSFNGRGYEGEKDNFYDMDYIRTGANAWFGYGLLFYSRQYGDLRYSATLTRLTDYILDHQVLTATDPRYGLFTGGFGAWNTSTNEFEDVEIDWVATEHNIGVYFFLRDLGQSTRDRRYADAADLLRANMPRLWDEAKGRLNQGMDAAGTLDTRDALDVASWGAIYWTAVGDAEKAVRSVEYADRAYSATVTITDPALVSAPLTVSGYRAYAPDQDYVWSEGSLGMAMAYLKLSDAAGRCDPGTAQGYLQKAQQILAEMVKIQSLDPGGGVIYALSESGELPDFAQAPSAAGTIWLLMVERAMEDAAVNEAFWGTDPGVFSCHELYLPAVLQASP